MAYIPLMLRPFLVHSFEYINSILITNHTHTHTGGGFILCLLLLLLFGWYCGLNPEPFLCTLGKHWATSPTVTCAQHHSSVIAAGIRQGTLLMLASRSTLSHIGSSHLFILWLPLNDLRTTGRLAKGQRRDSWCGGSLNQIIKKS